MCFEYIGRSVKFVQWTSPNWYCLIPYASRVEKKMHLSIFRVNAKFRDISLDLTIITKFHFCESFFHEAARICSKYTDFCENYRKFFWKTGKFPVITKMVTSFHILLTNFPFCNNPEENLKFVNFASKFCENAKAKIFVST